MITLIDSTETSATYEFTHDDCVRLVTFHKQEPQPVGEESSNEPVVAAPEVDLEAMASEEYSRWLAWLNVEQEQE